MPGGLRKQFAISVLASRPRGVLYTGMSSSLPERVRRHKEGLVPGFTTKYHVKRVVYFEYLNCPRRRRSPQRSGSTLAKKMENCFNRADRSDMARSDGPISPYPDTRHVWTAPGWQGVLICEDVGLRER